MTPKRRKPHQFQSFFCILLFIVSLKCVLASVPEPLPLGHHHGYVAQIVRPDPQQLFNHEAWHKKGFGPQPIEAATETAPYPSSSSTTSIFAPTTLPEQNEPPFRALAINSETEDTTDINWDQVVEAACSSALTSNYIEISHNPSGKVPCYNVKSLQPGTGTFEADLRIYQVSGPDKQWTDPVEGGKSLGLSYPHAKISQQQTSNQKRYIHGAGRVNGQDAQPAQAFMERRSGHAAPQKVGQLALNGQAESAVLDQLQDEVMAKELLTPKIRLSATCRDGTPMVLDLEDRRAFFITGVFANSSGNSTQAENQSVLYALDIRAIMAEGNRLRKSQMTPLLVASIWIVITTGPSMYGVMVRLRTRNEYRRRVRDGDESDVTVISYD